MVVGNGSDGMAEPWVTMILDYAKEISRQDFYAVIPDYLARTSTPPGFTVFGQITTHAADWQAVIQDAVQFARTLRGVTGSRVGLLGFSLGGYLCLRVREEAQLLVEFFAPNFQRSAA